jgi:CheY-like chemotaxis protein
MARHNCKRKRISFSSQLRTVSRKRCGNITMNEPSKTAPQRHVLVVDDNAELAETYRELLEAFDYRVTTAGNGERALKFIMENEVDAVLCDLSMPQLEGDEFYEVARRARPEVGRRFIFMTGHMNNPKYDPFLKSGNIRVLYKPVSVDKLLQELAAILAETAGK